ncbi:MAG: VWA domain-containing protein, partial [Cohaesibacteraceae bacterium]|nr:VWA domain-containing protein [Cohaesibacteraceae bacterium]
MSVVFLNFFANLRQAQIPVSLREYLMLLDAMQKDLPQKLVEDFYYLSRASLVKDERYLDRFDRVFSTTFKGIENGSGLDEIIEEEIPEEWLRKL